jgi:hypothetical protein
VILVSTALALIGVAGCSSSNTSANATAEPLPTVAPSQGAARILSTYQNYMAAYVTAYNTKNADYGPFVSLGGGNGGGLQAGVQDALDHGIFAEGKPSWSRPQAQFVDTNDTIASVTFCFNPGTWKTVAEVSVDATASASTSTSTSPSPAPSLTAVMPPLSSTSHPPHPAYLGDAVNPYIVLMLLNRHTAGNWTVAQTNAQPDHPC